MKKTKTPKNGSRPRTAVTGAEQTSLPVGMVETRALTCLECGSAMVKKELPGFPHILKWTCTSCEAAKTAKTAGDTWDGREARPAPSAPKVPAPPPRDRLPSERTGLTRRFRIPGPDGELKVYVTTGCYADGRLGEVFIKADKVGTFASGLLDQFAISMSLGLQRGVPLSDYTDKMVATKFEPAGLTGDAEFQICTSVMDLVGRYLKARYQPPDPAGTP